MAAGIAGRVVFGPQAWDVVLIPWIGNRSDREPLRPRRPWMRTSLRAATINPAALTAEVDALLEVAGVRGWLPERMAPVHALIAALSRPVAERLLSGILDLVYRPTVEPLRP